VGAEQLWNLRLPDPVEVKRFEWHSVRTADVSIVAANARRRMEAGSCCSCQAAAAADAQHVSPMNEETDVYVDSVKIAIITLSGPSIYRYRGCLAKSPRPLLFRKYH
jgi:hypothetical protein